MKKLIFSAVLGEAITGVVYAQSSLTIFGVADVMIQHGSGSESSRTMLKSGGMNSSRLGFRGTEDLDGGLSSSFWLESTVTLDDGGTAPTNTNDQANGGSPTQRLTSNRRSTVSLSSSTWVSFV